MKTEVWEAQITNDKGQKRKIQVEADGRTIDYIRAKLGGSWKKVG